LGRGRSHLGKRDIGGFVDDCGRADRAGRGAAEFPTQESENSVRRDLSGAGDTAAPGWEFPQRGIRWIPS